MKNRKVILEVITSDDGEFCSADCELIRDDSDYGPECPFNGTMNFTKSPGQFPTRNEDCKKAEREYNNKTGIHINQYDMRHNTSFED